MRIENVNLALKIAKAIHDRCENVPHDIGVVIVDLIEAENEVNKISFNSMLSADSPIASDAIHFFEYVNRYYYKGANGWTLNGWNAYSGTDTLQTLYEKFKKET